MKTETRTAPHIALRHARIAAGIVEGKSLAGIAREEGVSRQTIAKQAKSDDVQQILVMLVNAQLDRLEELFRRALVVIAEAFEARVVRETKEGTVVDLGPDHYARLTAVSTLIRLMTAGRPIPQAEDAPKQRRTMTLAELESRIGADEQRRSPDNLGGRPSLLR